jgi:hypothetical protein
VPPREAGSSISFELEIFYGKKEAGEKGKSPRERALGLN